MYKTAMVNDDHDFPDNESYDKNYLSGPFHENPAKTFDYLFDFVQFCWDNLGDDDDVLLVSVGCGNGYVEGVLQREFPDLPCIGVDPRPNYFHRVPV